jgi:hypothetical protein
LQNSSINERTVAYPKIIVFNLVQDFIYDRQQELVFKFWIPVDRSDAIIALHINHSICFNMVADGKNAISLFIIRSDFRFIHSDHFYCALISPLIDHCSARKF